MDSLLISPAVYSFYFNRQCSKSRKFTNSTRVSLLKFTPTVSFCCPSYPSNSAGPSPNCDKNGTFSFHPSLGFVQIVKNIRLLARSHAQGWDGGAYLQNGGIGVALLSVTTTAKVRISPFIAQLAANQTFVSGLFAWITAQSMKMFLNFFIERKWDFRILFASGGMPSSHSALCTALTTSVAICHGVADSLFPVCLGFSLIVMYDAIGVRRHAGMQAEVLNMIVGDLFQGHPLSQRKLKELLGHTPSQVLAGALLGIIVACICCLG